MDARSALGRLISPQLLDEITAKAAEEFTHSFARVEEAVVDTMDGRQGETEDVRLFWPRTVDEVTVLLN
jgi:hypothetical protein